MGETVVDTEVADQNLSDMVVLLGAASVYYCNSDTQPHWDPEAEYNQTTSPVIPV